MLPTLSLHQCGDITCPVFLVARKHLGKEHWYSLLDGRTGRSPQPDRLYSLHGQPILTRTFRKQIVSAIEIAGDPKAAQHLKGPALDFYNSLRHEPTAWQPCLNVFIQVPRQSQLVRLSSLSIVNDAVRAGIVGQADLTAVKDRLFGYIEREYSAQNGVPAATPDTSLVENKIAQTMTYLFCTLYDSTWTSFFDDLLSITITASGRRDNPSGVAFYLRVVNSVHDEVGDQLLARSREEQDRANSLKDTMRSNDVSKIVQSWREIFDAFGLSNGTIGELTAKAVGKWISWIDVSLVVNQPMLEALALQVGQKQIIDLPDANLHARDAAINAYTEIVSKKMSAEDKINMIDFMQIQSMVEKLSAWPILVDVNKPIYDVDLAEMVARLVNAVMLDIVRALDSERQTSATWQKSEHMLQSFLPQLLRYFSDDYDDVCTHVLPSMTDLLTFLRRAFQGEAFSSQRASILVPILRAIFVKSRVHEHTDLEEYDGDNTEEAEFIELRKRLSNLQQSIAATDERLFIDAVEALVNSTFEALQSAGQNLDWRSLDLALHEMYLLGDLAVKSGGLYQKHKPVSPPAEKLVNMMLLMIQSQAGSYPVPGIQIQFMEICVRYSAFFEEHADHLPAVLQNFLQLAHSPNLRVRLRSWYLLQRLVKQQRHHVAPVTDIIVPSLQDVLVIKATLPQDNDDDDDDSDEETTDSIFTSQLYLFETIGCIISTNSVPPEKQISYAQVVMQPLFTDIQTHLQLAKTNKIACLQVHHDLMALGNIARGYFDMQSATVNQAAAANIPAAIRDAFAQVSEVTLVALETLNASFDIRTAARFTFSRLLGMVGQQMLQQLPRWVDGFLAESSSRDEMAQLLRSLDQVTFGFQHDVFGFLDTLFGGLMRRVWAGFSTPANGTDEEVQLAELKREYLNFLLVILGNGLGGIIVSTNNQQYFEQVIESIEHFTKDVSDLTTAKMAFQLLSRMCIIWGGAEIVPNQVLTDVPQAQQQELPGFKQFMTTRFSPLAWAMPSNPNFNPKDAQSRQVLMEAAALQKTIYAKSGNDYITYLRDTELPTLGLQGPMMDDYFTKLTTLDLKAWKSWFAKFVSTGGGQS